MRYAELAAQATAKSGPRLSVRPFGLLLRDEIMTRPLEEILSVSREVQKFSVEALKAVVHRGAHGPLSALLVAPALILSRTLGHHTAINFLLEQSFVIEAGILTLTQPELCLDVLYIRSDVNRAREWIDHDPMGRAPWPVR